jgi:hypothetical protein
LALIQPGFAMVDYIGDFDMDLCLPVIPGRAKGANPESRSFPLEIPGLDLRSIPE